jgi:hypothetical protein
MDVWMYGCMDVWMYGCMDVWMYGCMDVWMYGCMDVWMYGCMTTELTVLTALNALACTAEYTIAEFENCDPLTDHCSY